MKLTKTVTSGGRPAYYASEVDKYIAQLEAENARLRKIEDAAELLVGDEGNPTDAWCLLLNALGGEQ